MIDIFANMFSITLSLFLFYYAQFVAGDRVPLEIFEFPHAPELFRPDIGDSFKQHSIHSDRHKDRHILQQKPGSHLVEDVRIFYQVGESEDSLPICAPNAVCSKIDLYEEPWIERQCRCPEKSVIHEPHKIPSDKSETHNRRDIILSGANGEHRLNVLDLEEKHLENANLRILLRKLGIVYKNDVLAGDAELTNDNIHNYEYRSHNDEEMKLRHFSHHRQLPSLGGCPSNVGIADGHTIADKTRHYKLCNPVHKLPICRYFRDYTWSLSILSDANITEQIVHCRCPKNSVTYLTKREPLGLGKSGYMYLFACSPQSRLRCQRKEPCTLFTVRKRQEFLDEVNTNPLCQCPKGHRCPRHHTEAGVITGKKYIEDNIHTYSGYCMVND